jgi:hypothetical protein
MSKPLELVKLTTPTGPAYIRKDKITAFAAASKIANGMGVKTNLWVQGQEESFNITETVGEVYSAVTGLHNFDKPSKP